MSSHVIRGVPLEPWRSTLDTPGLVLLNVDIAWVDYRISALRLRCTIMSCTDAMVIFNRLVSVAFV